MKSSKYLLKQSFRSYLLYFLLLSAVMACQVHNSINEAHEKAKILELHHSQRKFHFDKMAEAFADQLAEGHFSINRGEINYPSKAENIARYKNYFNNVNFIKWDDITDPVIHFSDDYSLAYSLVNKLVVLEYQDENGERKEEETTYAWLAIYKKFEDGWKINGIVSTNKASKVTPTSK